MSSNKNWKTLKNKLKCPPKGSLQFKIDVEENLETILDSLSDKLVGVKGIPATCPITHQIPRKPTNLITTDTEVTKPWYTDINSHLLEDRVYDADALSTLRVSPITQRHIITAIPDTKTRKKMIHTLTKNKDVYHFLCNKILSDTFNTIRFTNDTLPVAVKLWIKNQDAAKHKYGDISRWNTSNVTDMKHLFSYTTHFNDDIRKWDTSNVNNMSHMFFNTKNFYSDLSNWDTSNVNDMSGMFSKTTNFNGNLSNWDTSRVTQMEGMFSRATNLHGNFSNWDKRFF